MTLIRCHLLPSLSFSLISSRNSPPRSSIRPYTPTPKLIRTTIGGHNDGAEGFLMFDILNSTSSSLRVRVSASAAGRAIRNIVYKTNVECAESGAAN